jgi:hypothetical protein
LSGIASAVASVISEVVFTEDLAEDNPLYEDAWARVTAD